ncbi:MAG: SPOR domain-containing protein [Reichenbachiella sp.]
MNNRINRIALFPIISLTALLQFCAPGATKTTSSSSYHEDLSIYRAQSVPVDSMIDTPPIEEIVINVDPTHDISNDLDSITNLILESRKNIEYVNGFSIQIYSGNSRDKANQVKWKAFDLTPGQNPRVSYEQPNYKVRVGKYYTRIEANEDYNILKDNFSRSVLIPSKIKIKDDN